MKEFPTFLWYIIVCIKVSGFLDFWSNKTRHLKGITFRSAKLTRVFLDLSQTKRWTDKNNCFRFTYYHLKVQVACLHLSYLCMITCPSSSALWENIPDWPVGPSSAAGAWAVFPLPGWDATERLPAVEAPGDMHGPHWPPEHTHTAKSTQVTVTLYLNEEHHWGAKQYWLNLLFSARKKQHLCLCMCFIPAGHPVENLRGSFLQAACRGDGCAGSPGSQCRCPEPETEPSGPHVVLTPPSSCSSAADAPMHSSNNFLMILSVKSRQCSGIPMSVHHSERPKNYVAKRTTLNMKTTQEFSSFYACTGNTNSCLLSYDRFKVVLCH